jgi:hypothetical protein
VAHGLEELRTLFSDLTNNSSRAATLRRKQDNFLKDYFESSESDYWKAALNLVEEALGWKNASQGGARAAAFASS